MRLEDQGLNVGHLQVNGGLQGCGCGCSGGLDRAAAALHNSTRLGEEADYPRRDVTFHNRMPEKEASASLLRRCNTE